MISSPEEQTCFSFLQQCVTACRYLSTKDVPLYLLVCLQFLVKCGGAVTIPEEGHVPNLLGLRCRHTLIESEITVELFNFTTRLDERITLITPLKGTVLLAGRSEPDNGISALKKLTEANKGTRENCIRD